MSLNLNISVCDSNVTVKHENHKVWLISTAFPARRKHIAQATANIEVENFGHSGQRKRQSVLGKNKAHHLNVLY